MLPDIRAVVAAVVAALGLLMISFGLVAALRVAQENHAGSLQADLAQRGRSAPVSKSERRAVTVIDTPAPHVVALPRIPPLPVVEIRDAPIGEIRPIAAETPPVLAEPRPVAAVQEPAAAPPAAPGLGGPLAERAPVQADTERSAAEKAAARKAAAKKARAARLVRARKARAAQARRLKEQSAFGGFGSGFNTFGNFGNTRKQ